MGVLLFVAKDLDHSLQIWRRLLEGNPQSATLWVNLGSCLKARGEIEEARQALQKAREIDPFSSFVRSRSEPDEKTDSPR